MIYKMDSKEIKKLLIEFNETVYGKTMFLMCYATFFIIFAGLLFSFIIYLRTKSFIISSFIIGSAFLSIISFTIGSYAYYKELRIYARSKER